jgi:glycopeptide antibiotics resistance protein
MVRISFEAGIAVVLLGWLLCRGITAAVRKQISWKREAVLLFFLVNLLVIYRFTFHPFGKVDGKVQPLLLEWAMVWPFRMNLIPFVNLLDYDSKRDLLLNIIGNFAMFIPTGVMVPLLFRQKNTVLKVSAVGFFLSLMIEVIQLPFAVRASDVDDLILNTAGCMVGYGLYRLVKWMIHKEKTK